MFMTSLVQTNANIYAQTAINSFAVSALADFKTKFANEKFIVNFQKNL